MRAPAEAAPTASSGRGALRAAFYVGGLVATSAGLHTVFAGVKSLPGKHRASSSVESELRFYSAFYVAYGLVMLRTAPRADRDAAAVRGLSGALFLAGLARAGAWRATGTPHPGQRALLALELAIPPVLLALQARVAQLARGDVGAR